MQPYCIGGLKRATFSSTLIRMRFVLVATVIVAFSFAQVQGWIQTGGYVVLFGLLFACGLGLPLPEDVPLIVAGALIAKGQMNWVVAAICAWCGIIGGDCVLYYMGRRFGLEITRVPFIGKHVTKERIQRVEKLFHRHGVGVVAVGRLVAGIRGAMVVAAGAIRYNFVTFIIADGLAALVSGGLWMWLGHWLGANLTEKRVHELKEWIIAAVALLVVGFIAYLWWKRKHPERIEKAETKLVERVVTTAEKLPIPKPKPHPPEVQNVE